MPIYDYIVVGSGCSGAIAAQTLVEAGAKVTMLDVGVTSSDSPKVPNKDYLSLRRTDPKQYRYFIGDNAEGVNWGKIGLGAQITPPRRYIMRLVESFAPTKSSTFVGFESFAYGGMGAGWSIQSWEYNEAALRAAGLDYKKMSEAYSYLAKKIGISAKKNDATQDMINDFSNYQPPAKMDRNNSLIYEKYLLFRKSLNRKGITVGQTPLALLTQDIRGRKKYSYSGMDFYSDNGKSVWRPWITVDELKKKPNFKYIGGYLVVKFVEKKDATEVHCLDVNTNEPAVFLCRKLILGTGTLSSARIALRSSKNSKAKLPFLSNSYSYIPCIQPAMIGKKDEAKKLGFAQLSIFVDKAGLDEKASIASVHSYQSLMLFRLIKEVPFNLVDARVLTRYLSTGIVTLGVYHPDSQSKDKYVQLVPDHKSPTGDELKIEYALSDEEKQEYKKREIKLMKAMRKMGAYPIKRINPGFGSGIHYGGTLPFSDDEKPFTLSPAGRLHTTKRVYVADSSGFTYLPSPGPTFSIMANAHLVAKEALSASK
jgi:hypothetical protein